VAFWNTQALLGRSDARRAAKRKYLLPLMRQRAVLALQETHGTYEDLQHMADSTEHSYLAYHSQLQLNREKHSEPPHFSRTAGGIGFLLPYDKDERTRPPEERPLREFEVIVPGRAAWLRVTDSQGRSDVTIVNIHNFDLSPTDRKYIQLHLRRLHAHADAQPQDRLLVMVGDFNVSEHPPKSLNSPVDADTTAAQRYHYQPVYWRNIFKDLIEITTFSTTHRNTSTMAESTIDRCFISLPAHAMPNMETLLTANDAPLEALNGMDSDHKIMHLRIRPKRQRPPAERSIPAFIFDSPHYSHHIEKLLNMIDISAMLPTTK